MNSMRLFISFKHLFALFGSKSQLLCWNSTVRVSRVANREISLQEVVKFGHHANLIILFYFNVCKIRVASHQFIPLFLFFFLSSDLWAFGCIIYQLVAGLPPFRAG